MAIQHSTRAATYKVIINTLRFLPQTKLDAAFGIPTLVTLYAIRMTFDHLTKRYPHKGLFAPYQSPCTH